jgi:hypothetical protein
MRCRLAHARAAIFAVLALLPLIGGRADAQTAAPTQAKLPDDPLSKRAWHLDLTGHGGIETWNYNISHEDVLGLFAGMTYGIREGLAVKIGSPLYYVWQRDTDAYLFGLTWGLRGRLVKKAKWSAFWEFEVGVSEADTYVPPRGTRFNYLAIGGGGLTMRVRPGVHILGGLRWVHVSNNGLAGRSRNPDLEAVGPTVGLLYGF